MRECSVTKLVNTFAYFGLLVGSIVVVFVTFVFR